MLEGIKGVSTYASDVNQAFIIVTVITLFLFIATIGSMLFFIYKYRASKHSPENTKNIKHYTPIEIAWTAIPTILMMIVFYFGLDSLRIQRTMPKDDDSITIKVTAQRWFWTFEYENGVKNAELFIPVDKNIKLLMTAPKNDVLHAFYVPAFRTKEDIIPGQTTKVWFNATKVGKYDIQCAEYCGTRHSYMRSVVNVLSKKDYEQWLNPSGKKKEDLKKVIGSIEDKKETKIDGKTIILNNGCTGCHSLDGTKIVGPSFEGIYNRKTKVINKGSLVEVIADKKYIKNSIKNPKDDVVEGYPNIMPPYKDILKEKEIDAIIEYFKNNRREND